MISLDPSQQGSGIMQQMYKLVPYKRHNGDKGAFLTQGYISLHILDACQ